MKAAVKKAAVKPKIVKSTQGDLVPNAFIGKKQQPTDAELAAALGPAKPLWDQVVSALMSENPELVPEWKCSSPKLGWGLRLQRKKRNIVHFSPCAGSFRVGFIFGEKALEAVREEFRIPPRAKAGPSTRTRGAHRVLAQDDMEWGPRLRILDLIATAPKYAEGTGIRIQVTPKDVPAICKLARIKASN
jgi:hypothetical protein